MGEENEDLYSENTATFGDRLAHAREAAGFDQKKLAKSLGIKTKTIRNWEDDLSEPRANRLSMLSGLLNVSLAWLLTGEGNDTKRVKKTADQLDVERQLNQLNILYRRLDGEKIILLGQMLRNVLNDELLEAELDDVSAAKTLNAGVFLAGANREELQKLETAALGFLEFIGYRTEKSGLREENENAQ